jgi:hypothetical protein
MAGQRASFEFRGMSLYFMSAKGEATWGGGRREEATHHYPLQCRKMLSHHHYKSLKLAVFSSYHG